MTSSRRLAQAQRIKDLLDQLHDDALSSGMPMVAHLIGAASEAAADSIASQTPPPLRLVKTDGPSSL